MSNREAAAPITAEREAFERELTMRPDARFWNTTDAMFWAWCRARLSAPVAAHSARGTDAQILKERELTASTIRGAMMYGYQGVNPPPDTDAWLREFWDVGAEQRRLEVAAQPAASGVMINGLTEEETNATASVSGLVGVPRNRGQQSMDPQRARELEAAKQRVAEHARAVGPAVLKAASGLAPPHELSAEDRADLRVAACVFKSTPYNDNPQAQRIAATLARLGGVKQGSASTALTGAAKEVK